MSARTTQIRILPLNRFFLYGIVVVDNKTFQNIAGINNPKIRNSHGKESVENV